MLSDGFQLTEPKLSEMAALVSGEKTAFSNLGVFSGKGISGCEASFWHEIVAIARDNTINP